MTMNRMECLLSRGCGEYLVYFLVGRLGEVLVPDADGVERGRRFGAHDVVDDTTKFVARLGRRYGDRDDDTGRRLLAEREHGNAHRRAGGETIVDQDDGAMVQRGKRSSVAIGALTPLELALLGLGDGLD